MRYWDLTSYLNIPPGMVITRATIAWQYITKDNECPIPKYSLTDVLYVSDLWIIMVNVSDHFIDITWHVIIDSIVDYMGGQPAYSDRSAVTINALCV